jgi:hypothetical protein
LASGYQLASRATRNPDSEVVVLGKYIQGSSNSYEKVAQAKGATYFEIPERTWDNAVLQLGSDRMWAVNREFLDSQIAKGKMFEFTADPRLAKSDSFTALELDHLLKQGYQLSKDGKGVFYAVKK